MMLSVLFALFSIAASHRSETTRAPSLLLDLYNSEVIRRCDFQNLSSIAPIEVNPGLPNSVLIFNLTHIKHVGVMHLVFDGREIPHNLKERAVEVLIDGNRELLSLEPIRNSSIAIVNHPKLRGLTNLTVNMRDLEVLSFTLNNIFLMTNIDETCEAWKEFRASSESAKPASNKLKERSLRRRGVKTGCSRIPFEVDLRDIRRVEDEEADEFIYTPLTYDIGACGNRCVLNQYTPHALLRSVLRENIELNKNHTLYGQEVLKPACLPTGYSHLQVLFFSRVDNAMKLRLFKNVVVKECGCI